MLRNTKHQLQDLPARISPLEAPFDPEVGTILEAMMPAGMPPIGLFRTFAVNPTMTKAMHRWGSYELSRELSLDMRQREIVIDRTCARCGCEYEWGVHIQYFADRIGLTPDQVASITHGDSTDPCWVAEDERILLDVADSLHDHADIGDDLWERMSQAFTDEQILDLLLMCGWYHALSYVATAARVAPEPGSPRFVDHVPQTG